MPSVSINLFLKILSPGDRLITTIHDYCTYFKSFYWYEIPVTLSSPIHHNERATQNLLQFDEVQTECSPFVPEERRPSFCVIGLSLHVRRDMKDAAYLGMVNNSAMIYMFIRNTRGSRIQTSWNHGVYGRWIYLPAPAVFIIVSKLWSYFNASQYDIHV